MCNMFTTLSPKNLASDFNLLFTLKTFYEIIYTLNQMGIKEEHFYLSLNPTDDQLLKQIVSLTKVKKIQVINSPSMHHFQQK